MQPNEVPTGNPPGSTLSSESQHTMMQRLRREQEPLAGWEATNELVDELNIPDVDVVLNDTQTGNKLDSGKPEIALIPGHILADIAQVLTDGAARPEYGPDNWRGGLRIRRLLSAAMRHIMAFNDGQDYDPKSSFEPRCHLANAMCMLIFAMEMWKTRPDMDDRFQGLDHDMITEAFDRDPGEGAESQYEDNFDDLCYEELVVIHEVLQKENNREHLIDEIRELQEEI